MNVFVTLAAATGATLLALAPAPATAQGNGYYRATLASAAAKPTLITRDTVWRCTDTTCVAGKATARDTIVCELVVQRAGTLTAFSANGTTFDAAALEKCNARGK